MSEGQATALWRHPDFLKLWAGQTISILGTQVTFVALPLTAALNLGADAAELGLLRAIQLVPFLVLGLVAGLLVDRVRRRPVLILADIGHAVVLVSIPLAWLAGSLTLWHLAAAGFLIGTMRVVFSVAYMAYLPSLIEREQLVGGNARLGVSASVADIAGPGLGAVLVALVTAPLAILVDVGTFVISAVTLGFIHTPEPAPYRHGGRRAMWQEVGEGLWTIFRQPSLRTMTVYSSLINFCFQAINAIFVLFVTVELGLAPALFGVILMASSAGSLLGALLVPGLTHRLGLGPSLLVAASCYAIGALAIPLADGVPAQVLALLIPAWITIGVGNGIGNIVSVSLVQAVTPDRLLGRVSATTLTIGWGIAPIGALLGGAMGQVIGLRGTLLIAALGIVVTLVWLLTSPLRSLREASPPPATDERA